MKKIRTFMDDEGNVVNSANATWSREVIYDDDGRLIRSAVYFVEKEDKKND